MYELFTAPLNYKDQNHFFFLFSTVGMVKQKICVLLAQIFARLNDCLAKIAKLHTEYQYVVGFMIQLTYLVYLVCFLISFAELIKNKKYRLKIQISE